MDEKKKVKNLMLSVDEAWTVIRGGIADFIKEKGVDEVIAGHSHPFSIIGAHAGAASAVADQCVQRIGIWAESVTDSVKRRDGYYG